MKRRAEAIWKGTGKEGTGHLTTMSGALDKLPYSFKMRFENEEGTAGTNPEELLGATHAGCFNMALAVAMEKENITPEELHTKANVNFEKTDAGFRITNIHLDLTGKVPGISEEKFKELAEGAKKGCPISNALAAVDITMEAKLA